MKTCGIGFDEKVLEKKEKAAKMATFKDKIKSNGGAYEYLKKIKDVDPAILEILEALLQKNGFD
jgi:hypothetical protein